MNTKNEKPVINDKELEEVNGGFIPIILSTGSKVPAIDPVPLKPEYEKNSEKDTLVPIPY